MASYCTKCGAALTGSFCANCGARSDQTQPTAATPASVAAPATAGSKSSPVLKVVLIVLCVFGVVAALGVAGLVYAGYKAKEKITQVAREAGIDLSQDRPAPAREQVADGCFHLPSAEAGAVLGVRVVRTEPRAPEGCIYFGDPAETAERSVSAAREGYRELQETPAAQDAQRALEKITHGFVGSAGSEGLVFAFTIDRNDAGSKWAGFKIASKMMGGMSGGAETEKQGVKLFESVPGLGKEAIFTPLGATLHVIQDGAYLEMDFRGAPADRDKKLALARKVLSTL
ncbi:MAG: hypothetical protein KIT09_12120 [Bryobacteraceae bacterium]|nr:hypothetical protein [Bryobacteraceae bacterium]